MATRDEVLRALSPIRDPDLGRDVVSLDMIKDLDIPAFAHSGVCQ